MPKNPASRMAGLVVLLIAAATASAEDDLGPRLLEVMGTKQNFETIAETLDDVIKSQLSAMGIEIPPNAKPVLERQQSELKQLVFSAFLSPATWNRMGEQMEDVFSTEELTALIQFYESPVGIAFVEKSPELIKRQTSLSQEVVADLSPQIQAIMAHTRKELSECADEESKQ